MPLLDAFARETRSMWRGDRHGSTFPDDSLHLDERASCFALDLGFRMTRHFFFLRAYEAILFFLPLLAPFTFALLLRPAFA